MSDIVNNSQGFILQDSGFSGSCHKGTLVAQNSSGVYVPAEAVWDSDVVRSDGSWVPSYSAYVKGVLITEPVNGYATILCNGWSNDPDLLDSLEIDEDEGVGDYFLTTGGKATRGDLESREMRVYCYSVLGSGKIFVKPEPPEYAGHSHNHVLITTTWVAANQATGVTLPEAANYATDLSASVNLNALITANPNHTCLVKNGEEVMEGTWGIVDTWLYITFNLEVNDVFSLHAITPLTANEPIVRSVQKTRDNSLLDISSTGGKVFIGINNTPTDTNAYTGTGVVSLDSTGIKTGPVVQELKAGPGISLSGYTDPSTHTPVLGTVTVTATQFAGTMIDMNVCNLDRVVMGTSFNGISYVFPQGATSLLIGTMRVPHFESNTVGGKLVFVFLGGASGLTAYVTVQPTPTSAAPTLVATPIERTIPATSGSDNYCYRSEVDLGTDIMQSDALLILKISAASPAQAITLLSASLTLY